MKASPMNGDAKNMATSLTNPTKVLPAVAGCSAATAAARGISEGAGCAVATASVTLFSIISGESGLCRNPFTPAASARASLSGEP